MRKIISLGTVTSQPGTIQYGRWDALTHPTGHTEFLPVIIAQSKEDGPCLWLTAGIHGPEHAGPIVLYRLITQELVDRMKGTIVAIPALNPAGLRTMKREPYHAPKDPNRLWPDGKPEKPPDPDKDAPSSLEHAFKRLFDEMVAGADYLIDYHNAWTGSISFVFRDRVMYRADADAEKNKAEAEALAARQEDMIRAYGHTIVTEFPAEKYIDDKLHRSTSGAALLVGKIPSFTVELGTGHMPDPRIVAASVAGTRNVMRWAGMLDGMMEPIAGIKVVDPGFRVRRARAPRASEASSHSGMSGSRSSAASASPPAGDANRVACPSRRASCEAAPVSMARSRASISWARRAPVEANAPHLIRPSMTRRLTLRRSTSRQKCPSERNRP